jgi:alpha-methylacyl-CoA racemase
VKALQGLKILDLTSLWPGPLATLVLADLGAEVLRIEPPDRPDLLRYMEPLDDRGDGAAWSFAGRGKRSLALNLKSPEGREIFAQLLGSYDIVVEQFRPGVLDRLGVGYEAMAQRQPRLIWCSITGFGQEGPWRDRPGHDINYLAASGLAHLMGGGRGGPTAWTALAGDVAGGTWPALVGILAAVIQRSHSGVGQHIDIAMAEGALFLNALAASGVLAGGEDPAAGQGILGGASTFDYYATSDGRWVSLALLEPKFWQGFCAAVRRPDLLSASMETPEQMAALKVQLQALMASQPYAYWLALFERIEVCAEPVRTTAEALALPHFVARGTVIQVPRPAGGEVAQLANPVRLSASSAQPGPSAPLPGWHTREVLFDLGLTSAQVDALCQSGAALDGRSE